MAGEVAHVVYAARVLEHLQDQVSGVGYYLGTLFPDIRHLGLVSRHRTHPTGVGLSSLVGRSDFDTGLRVHAWIDATREKFWQDEHMKESLPWHPFVPHALKLLEDEIVYPLFHDWPAVMRALQTVSDDELYFVESKEHIARWHDILRRYFSQPPNDASRLRLALEIGLSEYSAQEINSVVTQLRSHKPTQALIQKFHVAFDALLA